MALLEPVLGDPYRLSKLVSVYATKFSPDVNSEALASYLKHKLHREKKKKLTAPRDNITHSKSLLNAMMWAKCMSHNYGQRVSLCSASLKCANQWI